MSQGSFERRHTRDWQALGEVLEQLEDRRLSVDPEIGAAFPALYRRVCQHLALARHRLYGADLIAQLNDLALRGHQHLYRQGARSRTGWVQTLLLDFPRTLRASSGALWAATVAFVVPAVTMYIACRYEPDLIYTLVDPAQVAMVEEMYDPQSDHFLRERGSASDLQMFGYYIRNNIGIGFRTFAGGMLFGVGALFFLVFNGLFIGAIAGHLDQLHHGETFWSFVIGHGAFELTALVLSGATGLRLGLALLSPGRRGRAQALAEETRAALPQLYGFTAMLIIAAFIEAFWSSMVLVPASAKLTVGAGLWVAVLGYLILAGRTRGS